MASKYLACFGDGATLQNFSEEELRKVQDHIMNFCKSVKLTLAVVRGDQEWKPVYLLAEYSYLPSEVAFKALFDTPQFRIVSGRIDVHTWETNKKAIVDGTCLYIPLEQEGSLTIAFRGKWAQSGVYFRTGQSVRSEWNRRWPCLVTNLVGGKTIDPGLWSLMENVAITYVTPYTSISEVINDVLGLPREKLRFEVDRIVHGSVLLPIFACLESANYEREKQKVSLVAKLVYHSNVDLGKIGVSARVEKRDQTVERLPKSSPADETAFTSEGELLVAEWESLVEASVTSINRTSLYLSYEEIESLPLLIDEKTLFSVPEVTSREEIERIMTKKAIGGRAQKLDYLLKIEKMLFGQKSNEFEEALFILLCRLGFDVAWENRNDPLDILALSPNGCLAVECTLASPNTVMARELKNKAQQYRSQENPRVIPVLALSQTTSSELDQGLQKMEQEGEICILTKDRLKQLLDALKKESSCRTEHYLSRYFTR
jgi:hypothetical protein